MINSHVLGVGSVLLSEIRAKHMDRNASTLREVGNNIFQLLKDGEKTFSQTVPVARTNFEVMPVK